MASKAPDYVPRGVFLMTVLTEGTTPDNKADRSNLDSWITSSAAPHSVTLDSPGAGLETFFNVGKEYAIIVELKTMKIVDILYGAQNALKEIDTLP